MEIVIGKVNTLQYAALKGKKKTKWFLSNETIVVKCFVYTNNKIDCEFVELNTVIDW